MTLASHFNVIKCYYAPPFPVFPPCMGAIACLSYLDIHVCMYNYVVRDYMLKGPYISMLTFIYLSPNKNTKSLSCYFSIQSNLKLYLCFGEERAKTPKGSSASGRSANPLVFIFRFDLQIY